MPALCLAATRSVLRVALHDPRDLDARRRAELEEDVAHVRLDGLLRQEQRLRDLAVREPVGHEPGDLELALGEAAQVRVAARAARLPAGAEPAQLAPRRVAPAQR